MNPRNSGVNASLVALPGEVGQWSTLLDFFAARFPQVSRDTWNTRFENEDISYLDSPAEPAGAARRDPNSPPGERSKKPFERSAVALEKIVARAGDAPRAHARLTYFRRVESETPIPFHEMIVYQDELIVVADKPHFLPVVPSGDYVQETLLARLQKQLDIDTLTPIHRIDRETAGLVVFCVQPRTRGVYQALFRERLVTKKYEAIAAFLESLATPGVRISRLVDAAHFMQMEEVAGEPNSETRIEMVERRGDFARYSLSPRTGKRHQLRAHMSALGAPILNDRIYPTLQRQETVAAFDKPLQLLAKSVEFVDPITHLTRRFTSERYLWARASTARA